MDRRSHSGSDRSEAQPGERARMSLALWLRQGRAQKNLSIDDVARITKIQTRILEQLESGQFAGLPADVFVRGFVRNFARAVGLDETEALTRYVACNRADAAGTTAGAAARAFVETMSELAPATARTVKPRVLDDEAPADEEAAASASSSTKIEVIDVADVVVAAPMVFKTDAELEAEMAELADAETRLAAGTMESVIVPSEAEPVVEPVATETVEAAPPAKKKRTRKSKTTSAPVVAAAEGEPAPRRRKKAKTTLSPIVTPTQTELPVVETVAAVAAPAIEEIVAVVAPAIVEDNVAVAVAVAVAVDDNVNVSDHVEVVDLWTPKMPLPQPTVPWRRPHFAAAPVVPSIVIDDADPDSAERELEDRRETRTGALRSFLPPILLDREDRSARQGGLTLAVIILLIAATLTLSYLMRRPGSAGAGMTEREVPTQVG
jgi:hypothetical protein